MKLIEIENELKEMLKAVNVSDSDIFNKIYQLGYEYIKRYGHVYDEKDRIEIATMLTEDLYLKLYKGGSIKSWIGYMSFAVKASIRQYRKMTSTEIFDVSENPAMIDGILSACTDTTDACSSQYSKIYAIDLINELPHYIKRTLENCCRYKMYTSEWNSIYLCILVSLANNKTVITHIEDEGLKNYVKLMCSLILDKISQKLRTSLDLESKKCSSNALQLFTLENLEIADAESM